MWYYTVMHHNIILCVIQYIICYVRYIIILYYSLQSSPFSLRTRPYHRHGTYRYSWPAHHSSGGMLAPPCLQVTLTNDLVFQSSLYYFCFCAHEKFSPKCGSIYSVYSVYSVYCLFVVFQDKWVAK